MFWLVSYWHRTPPAGLEEPGVAGAREDADVPAVPVGLAVGEAGRRIAAAHDLAASVGVQVGHGSRGEDRVTLEPGEPAQHGSVARAQGIGVLAEGAGLDAVAVPIGADGERGGHGGVGRGVGRRVRFLDEPLVPGSRRDGLVAPGVRGGRVAAADEDGVEPEDVDGCDRGRGVDRCTRVVRPTAHRGAIGQVEGVDPTLAIAEDRRRASRRDWRRWVRTARPGCPGR